MKFKIMMLCSGLAFGIVSCNDNAATTDADRDTTTSTTTTTTPEATTTTTTTSVDVPQATRTSFETKYPNARNVRWTRYEVRPDRAQGDWDYTLDTSDYQVMFNWDGADYYAWYDDGNFVRATSTIKDHSKLPANITAQLRKNYEGFEIVEVDKEHDKDRTTYEIELKKGEDKVKVHYDENGKEVKKKTKIDGEKTKTKEEDNH